MQEKIERLNTIEFPRFGNQRKTEVALNWEKEKQDIERIRKEINAIGVENKIQEAPQEQENNLLEKVSELYYLDSLRKEDIDGLVMTMQFQPENFKLISNQVRKLYKKAGAFEKEKIMEFVCSFYPKEQ